MYDIAGGAQIAFGGEDELSTILGGDYSGLDGVPGPAPQHHGGNGYGLSRDLGLRGDARMAFMRQLAAKNAALLVDRPMTKARELPLGFPAAALASGGTVLSPTSAVSLTQPQVVYRGRRLFVTPSALGVCVVQDLKVGKDSQLVAAEPLPAEMFSPLSFGSDMNLDTAQVSQIIALYLGNIGSSAISVTAGLQGTAIY
jgi:hypothetical protein